MAAQLACRLILERKGSLRATKPTLKTSKKGAHISRNLTGVSHKTMTKISETFSKIIQQWFDLSYQAVGKIEAYGFIVLPARPHNRCITPPGGRACERREMCLIEPLLNGGLWRTVF